jgi:hypothetical protein
MGLKTANRSNYANEKRAALEQWATHVLATCEGIRRVA